MQGISEFGGLWGLGVFLHGSKVCCVHACGSVSRSSPLEQRAALGSRVTGIRYILGLYRGYIGIMEKKMETTIQGFRVSFVRRVISLAETTGTGSIATANTTNPCLVAATCSKGWRPRLL